MQEARCRAPAKKARAQEITRAPELAKLAVMPVELSRVGAETRVTPV